MAFKKILVYLIYYLGIASFLVLTFNKGSFYYIKRLLIL
jgi:hypothetical protein